MRKGSASKNKKGFFENFLKRARVALHSYTHAGVFQLGRRFHGNDIVPRYSEGEIVEVIRTTTSACFMVTALLTKHFGFEEEWKEASQMFEEWGSGPNHIAERQ